MTIDNNMLDAKRIMELLPHRYPFLPIDRITACQPGESITALKNVTINEPVFQGHFPGRPIMPGVLIIEAMAQAGGVLSHVTLGDVEPKPLFFLAGVNNTRFRRTVLPGEPRKEDSPDRAGRRFSRIGRRCRGWSVLHYR